METNLGAGVDPNVETDVGTSSESQMGSYPRDHGSTSTGVHSDRPTVNNMGSLVTNSSGHTMGMGTRTSMGQDKQTGRDNVTFEMQQHIGTLSTSPTGWTKELNIVSWNNRQPRLDIREWCPDHQRMSRGIGIRGNEIAQLKRLLSDFDPEIHGI